MSARAPPAIEGLDDDVVVIERLAAPVKPATSRALSMPEVGLEEQRPIVSSMLLTLKWMSNPIDQLLVDMIILSGDKQSQKAVHDMSELDRFMHNFIKIHQSWKDKAMAIAAKRNAALQHLQVASDKMKMMEEREKSSEEKNSRLKIELEST
ncbi:hypothetical protein COCNU_scaffold005300G000010 [Cocos nucifera]|nr:hypothetical protein [Cocos nucifera]